MRLTRDAIRLCRSALTVLCCLLCIPVVAETKKESVAQPVQSVQPIKSDLDTREYRYLQLANGLSVLLVYDAKALTAAAALNVAAGSNQNPSHRPGLAHFLEHVLLLGSKAWPAGEYQQFIAQSGGSHNAFTTAENTQFYFSVRHDALEPALDRFSQLFIAPAFDPVSIESERQVIEAEFSANLLNDARREWDVIREVMNPEHPAAAFAVGNAHTFSDESSSTKLNDDLKNFYHAWYSADRMSLVVLGSQPLPVLQDWVEKRFTKVPRFKTVEIDNYPSWFLPGFLPANVEIQSQKNTRRLSFRFPVPYGKKYLENKPFDYLGHLLGHENKGSFISLLQDLGWAESLHSGLTLSSQYDALFQVNIQLTEAGLRAREQIVSLLFFAIDQIKQQGLNEWRYQELQLTAGLGFRFSEKKSPVNTVTGLATAMQHYTAENLLRGPWSYNTFNEKELRECLEYLRPDNVLQVLMMPEINAYRVSDYYAVPYAVRRGIAEILPIKPGVRQSFALPDRNPFIPEKMIVKSGSLLDTSPLDKQPELLVKKNLTRIWYQQDHQYNRPHSAINLRLSVPPEKMTAERAALNHLFAALMNDQLNDRAYFASLAGLSLSIQPHTRGIDLRIFGYSNRQSLLLNHTISSLNKPAFSEAQFRRIKNRLLRFWKNQEKDSPYQQVLGSLPSLLVSPEWSAVDLADALVGVEYPQLMRFSRQFLWDARIDGLIYGNYLPQEAMKLSAIIEHGLQSRQTGRGVASQTVRNMDMSQQQPWVHTYALKHPDKAVALYIQAPSHSEKDAAHMMLLRQILQPAFFQQLRADQQSGYLVSVLPAAMLQIEGSILLVQSPDVTEEELSQRIDQFLEQPLSLVPDVFSQQKSSLLLGLQEPARSISEQNNRYWQAILSGDTEFTRQQNLITAIESVTTESLTAYYKEVFQNKNRRLWMMTQGVSANSVD